MFSVVQHEPKQRNATVAATTVERHHTEPRLVATSGAAGGRDRRRHAAVLAAVGQGRVVVACWPQEYHVWRPLQIQMLAVA